MNATCIECSKPTTLLEDSSPIYNGKNYGPLWVCFPCRSYVGCHPGTNKPLGTAAGPATRYARKLAHAAFDPIWKWNDTGSRLSRGEAYSWLAKELGIPKDQCHIGMMSEQRCYIVVLSCIKRRRDFIKANVQT